MTINVLKPGDNVLSVNKDFIAVRRKNGEVDIIPFITDDMGLRLSTEQIVTIGYGNNTVSAELDDGITITNY